MKDKNTQALRALNGFINSVKRGIAEEDQSGSFFYIRPSSGYAKKMYDNAEQVRTALEQQSVLVLALEKLSKLGNGNMLGNSEGNLIAQKALNQLDNPKDKSLPIVVGGKL